MLLNRQGCGPRAARSCHQRHQQPLATAAPASCTSRPAGCTSLTPSTLLHASGAKCMTTAGRRCTAVHATPADGRIDVVGLGNLCVDAVLPLEELPPPDMQVRRQLLDQLTASPPDPSSWEVGGNCNFMVAAARLGLRVASVGHIGRDVYGDFMDQVLREEGIQETTRIAPPAPPSTQHQQSPCSSSSSRHHHQQPSQQTTATTTSSSSTNHACCCGGSSNNNTPSSRSSSSTTTTHCSSSHGGVGGGLDSTLICFVLVDPASRHAFCSRYDFGPWPLLDGIGGLPERASQVLRASRAIFTNGFIFDELPLEVVRSSCEDAIRQGAAIFFDPGPRCQTMLEGPRRAALDLLLDLSAVVLMTEEEARVVTGFDDPEAAARWVLARPNARAAWAVVKMGEKGALLCARRTAGGAAAAGVQSSNGNGSGNGNGNGNGRSKESGEGSIATTRVGSVKVEVVDTVGCGDSFAAAIVMGYINGWPADVTLALANAVGGATATGRGAGRNVARRETVLELLQEGAAGRSAGGGAAGAVHASAFARARELLLMQEQQGAPAPGKLWEGLPQQQSSPAA